MSRPWACGAQSSAQTSAPKMPDPALTTVPKRVKGHLLPACPHLEDWTRVLAKTACAVCRLREGNRQCLTRSHYRLIVVAEGFAEPIPISTGSGRPAQCPPAVPRLSPCSLHQVDGCRGQCKTDCCG